MELDFGRPGAPTDNAFIEAFNGRFRQECLNEHWFLSLADAEEKVESSRRHYNGEMLHSALGNLSPRQFAALEEMADCPAKLPPCLEQNMGQDHYRLLYCHRFLNEIGGDWCRTITQSSSL